MRAMRYILWVGLQVLIWCAVLIECQADRTGNIKSAAESEEALSTYEQPFNRAFCPDCAVTAKNFSLRLLHTDYLDSLVAQSRSGNGGFARLDSGLSQLRKEVGTPSLTVDAGNFFGFTSFFQFFQGYYISQYMAYMGYNAVNLGYSEVFESNLLSLANFKSYNNTSVVSSNVNGLQSTPTSEYFMPFAVTEVNGTDGQTVKVGIVGYADSNVCKMSVCLRTIFISEIVSSLSTAIFQLLGTHPDVNVIVALSSAGYEIDVEIAAQLQFVNVIVGTRLSNQHGSSGDNETPIFAVAKNADLEPVLLTSTKGNSEYIGIVDLEFVNSIPTSWNNASLFLANCDISTPCVQPNATMEEEIKHLYMDIEDSTHQVIGNVGGNYTDLNCRTEYCQAGQFIANSALQRLNEDYQSCDFFFFDGGSANHSIGPGNVTVLDVDLLYPYPDKASFFLISGEILISVVRMFMQGTYQFLQNAGLRISKNWDNPSVISVTNVEVLRDGVWTEVVPTNLYNGCATDYISKGNDGYTILARNVSGAFDDGPSIDYLLRKQFMVANITNMSFPTTLPYNFQNSTQTKPNFVASCTYEEKLNASNFNFTDYCSVADRSSEEMALLISPKTSKFLPDVRSISIKVKATNVNEKVQAQLAIYAGLSDSGPLVTYFETEDLIGLDKVVHVPSSAAYIAFVSDALSGGEDTLEFFYEAETFCSPGYYIQKVNNISSCMPCSAGSYRNEGADDSECKVCPKGTYSSLDGSPSCAKCDGHIGLYSDLAGSTGCTYCSGTRKTVIVDSSGSGIACDCETPLIGPDCVNPEDILSLTGDFGILIVVLSGVGLMSVIVITILLIAYRRHGVVKASSLMFCLFVLFGLFVAFCAPPFYFGRPTTAVCYLRDYLLVFGAVIIFASLVTKLWRVWRVFDNPDLEGSKSYLTDSRLALYILCLVGIDFVIVVGLTFVDKRYVSAQVSSSGYVDYVCKGGEYEFITASVFNFMLLIAGLFLSFKTRKVPAIFAEAKYVGYSIYVTAALVVVCVCVVAGLRGQNHTFIKLCSITIELVAITILCFIFLPKLFSLKKYSSTDSFDDHRPEFSSSTSSVQLNKARKDDTSVLLNFSSSSIMKFCKYNRTLVANIMESTFANVELGETPRERLLALAKASGLEMYDQVPSLEPTNSMNMGDIHDCHTE